MQVGDLCRLLFLRTRRRPLGNSRPSSSANACHARLRRGPVPPVPSLLSSESPMLNAFWRVASSVLLSFLAIRDALVFFRAIVLSSRSSLEVHARRFFFLFAIDCPLRDVSTCVAVNDRK